MKEQDRQYKEKMKNGMEQLAAKAEERAKKEIIKKIIAVIGAKGVAILVLIVLICSILGVVFLASAVYFDDLDTKSKATSAKNAAVGNGATGKILTMQQDKYKIEYNGKTGREAIKEILEDNNMNFDDFTEEEIECLYKCLKAEWATTYPNLGGNVDNKDINSDYVQGAIVIKKANADGTIMDLTYLPYDELVIKEDADDEDALNYFSLKDGNLVVACRSYTKTEYITSGDVPSYLNYQNTEKTTITERMVDYKGMLGVHTMSFEFLLSLLVNTEDVDFVSDLADTAFDNNIIFTVYENSTTTISRQTEYFDQTKTYDKNLYYRKEVTWNLNGKSLSYPSGSGIEPIGNLEEHTYYEVRTIVTNTDTSYAIALSGESWLASIKNEYNYVPEPQNGKVNDLGLGSPSIATTSLENEHITNTGNDADAISFQNNNSRTTSEGALTTSVKCIVYLIVKNNVKLRTEVGLLENSIETKESKYENTNNTTDEIGIKFKEVYDNNAKAQAQLDCVSSWLFELLEETEETIDYVSIMKYLLYVCTGEDYGVTEEDINAIIEESFFKNEFISIYSVAGEDQKVKYKDRDIIYSAKFAAETRTPAELGIPYTTQTGCETTNYDGCIVCNESPAQTTATGISLKTFPKVVAKWLKGSFVEYGDWVYIDGWGYALVADCGGFTGKSADYYHLDCFVGQEGDIIDDGGGTRSALNNDCLNKERTWNCQPGNREHETIYVIKAKDAQEYIEKNYAVANGSSKTVQEMLKFGAQAVGWDYWTCRKNGILSERFKKEGYFAWCSAFVYSLYEHAGFITYSEASKLDSKNFGITSAAYWQIMDGGKHYNGYLNNYGNWRSTKAIGDANYMPKVGDLVLFSGGSGLQYTSHVGIVYEINGNKMTTLEGNSDSSLCKLKPRTYGPPGTPAWGNTVILGYFSLESFLNSKGMIAGGTTGGISTGGNTNTVNNGEYIEVKHGRAIAQYGKKQGFAQNKNRAKWDDLCLEFSIVYATAIKNNNTNLILKSKAGIKADSIVGAIWPKRVINYDKQNILGNVYDEISKGRPCILQVNGNSNGTSRHYVVVIGYNKNVTSRETIKETDLLIFDVWDAEIEQVGTKGSGKRFMIKGTDTIWRGYGYEMYKLN